MLFLFFFNQLYCPYRLSLICFRILKNFSFIKKESIILLVCFSALCIRMVLRGFVLCFHSRSSSKYVTQKKTMKNMALAFVVIILCLESCHNAYQMETRSVISYSWRSSCQAEEGSRYCKYWKKMWLSLGSIWITAVCYSTAYSPKSFQWKPFLCRLL